MTLPVIVVVRYSTGCWLCQQHAAWDYGKSQCMLIMNTGDERRLKQCEYQQWYRERNREALLQLRRIINMNETQNGHWLLDVWLI